MLHCRSLNYENTPLSIRERLSFTSDEQLAWVSQHLETILLITCNRVELYTCSQRVDELWAGLLSQKHLDSAIHYTTQLSEHEAAQHLFYVASSLKSMALGEAQILGQVTNALEQAKQTCGHQLSMLFRATIHAAKRIHTETTLGHGQVSISSLGINRIEQTPGNLTESEIVVIGAGEMGQAVIKGLDRRNARHVTLISRTYERARLVAEEWHMQARPMTQLQEMLVQADIVFTTSSAPFPILTVADLEPIMAQRHYRPLYLVDIAVPRDVEMEVTRIEGVHLYNLDELEQVVQSNRQEREAAIPHAEAILEEELGKFWQEYKGQAAVPTIRQLRDQVEQIRQAELTRIMNRLPHENHEEVRQLLEEFSHRFMNKVLHQPTHTLKNKADHSLYNSVARDLFGLEDAS